MRLQWLIDVLPTTLLEFATNMPAEVPNNFLQDIFDSVERNERMAPQHISELDCYP